MEPVHNNYNIQWLGKGLYLSNSPDDAGNFIEENYYILDVNTGKRFIEHSIKEAFNIWFDSKYFAVRGDDYIEVFDFDTRKSKSRMNIREFDIEGIGKWGEDRGEGVYYKNDLSANLEVSPYFQMFLEDGYFSRLEKSNFSFWDLAGNGVLIEKDSGKILAIFPQAGLFEKLGQYNWIYRNEKHVIVDDNNKEFNVKGDIDFAGPISDSKFFYVVSNNGNKETFIYDSEKNKNVMQFPGECYGMDAYPHFYRISSTPQFFIFEDGQLLKD